MREILKRSGANTDYWKAISVRQPWAWAIIHGGKDIENRDWSTNLRGRVLIHASKGMTAEEYAAASKYITCAIGKVDDAWLTRWLGVCAAPNLLQRGGIIGSVEIVDCVERSDSPWFMGKYGFVLRDPQPIEFTEWKGRLSFFNVPDSALPYNAINRGCRD